MLRSYGRPAMNLTVQCEKGLNTNGGHDYDGNTVVRTPRNSDSLNPCFSEPVIKSPFPVHSLCLTCSWVKDSAELSVF